MSELIKYLVCGVLTTIVSIGSFYVSTLIIGIGTTVQLQTSNIISFICAVIFAYMLSRLWVFGKSGKSVGKEFFEFVSCRILTLFVDMTVMQVLVFYFGFTEIIAKLIVQVIVTVLNYVFSKKIIFNKEKKREKNND